MSFILLCFLVFFCFVAIIDNVIISYMHLKNISLFPFNSILLEAGFLNEQVSILLFKGVDIDKLFSIKIDCNLFFHSSL